MLAARLLDVVLVLVVLAYLVVGWRSGFAQTLSAILGIIVGAVLAFVAVPLVAGVIPSPEWRALAAVATAIALLIGGHALGASIGTEVRGRVRRRPLALVDRLLGAAIAVVVTALTTSLVLGSVGALGVPLLSRAVAGSTVAATIDRLTPEPVQALLSRVRSAVLQEGLPAIAEALGGVTTSPGAPQLDGGPRLTEATRSVVRVSGTAYACGQNQTGSGVVIAPDRVVTNAHVVAGVGQPIIEAPDGAVAEGRVVLFDPDKDLAVIATDGLPTPALRLGERLEVDDRGAVAGYPFGGPMVTGGASVLAVSPERVSDIYGTGTAVREVYSLAAVVDPGNSGGPVLSRDGRVVGIVFAESANDPELGYAVTTTELAPVAEAAPGLNEAVGAGRCVRD